VAISEKTRKEDEKLREKLKHVDPTKLKKVIKALVVAVPTAKQRSRRAK
jgi:hypothetical protein